MNIFTSTKHKSSSLNLNCTHGRMSVHSLKRITSCHPDCDNILVKSILHHHPHLCLPLCTSDVFSSYFGKSKTFSALCFSPHLLQVNISLPLFWNLLWWFPFTDMMFGSRLQAKAHQKSVCFYSTFWQESVSFSNILWSSLASVPSLFDSKCRVVEIITRLNFKF